MKLNVLLVFGLMAAALAQEFAEERQADEDEAAWSDFKKKHKKNYKDKNEEKRRKGNFQARNKKIKAHNSKAGKGHKLRVNKFADWDESELRKLRGEIEPQNDVPGPVMRIDWQNLRQSIPNSVDLRNDSCMTPMKFQGGCGSCYAFAAATPLEFQRCKKTGQLVTVSEQNLVDCSQSYGNLGCNGGLALRAWNYVAANGINSEALYPYKGLEGTCRYVSSAKTAVVSSWAYATRVQDEEAIRLAVALYGPVAVSIDANEWEFYGSGVFSSPDCSTIYTNHAVVIVGYGFDAESGKKYWIIRNSWDVDWGLDGYILLERGVNMCAVGKRPVYPTVI